MEWGFIEHLKRTGQTHIRGRRKDVVPENCIRFLATQLLHTYLYQELRPNPFLMLLIEDIAGVKKFGTTREREPHRRKVAILMMSLNPGLSIGELAIIWLSASPVDREHEQREGQPCRSRRG